MFPFFRKPTLMDIEEAAVKRAICRVVEKRSHYGFSGHPHVQALEEALSRRFGGLPVLGVGSGTDALILALRALGAGPDSEVIVPAFSFVSTAACIPWVGATPVFVDIRPDDYSLDPAKIEEKITEKTKAIIIAHLFGQPATGMEEILAVARRHALPVIEDAAQSFGAQIKLGNEWKPVGAIGDIGCLSFSSTKPFSAPGNGGAVVVQNKALHETIDRMRFYGARQHYRDYPIAGVNCKIHDMQAAALLAKLNFFDHWLARRTRIAAYYAEALAGVGDLILPQELPGSRRTWYRYVIRTRQERDHLFHKLIMAAGPSPTLHPAINYPVPLPYFGMFRDLGHAPGDFPAADEASREVLSLPITNYVSLANARRMTDVIGEFFASAQ